jgi:hypothetical protein
MLPRSMHDVDHDLRCATKGRLYLAPKDRKEAARTRGV